MNDPNVYEDSKAHVRRLLEEFWPKLLQSLKWSHGQRILDYGCGPGTTCLKYFAPYVEKWDGHIVAVDVSAEMVGFAREKASHPRVEYHQANIFELESRSGSGMLTAESFDAILCSLVFHFLKPHKQALVHFASLLKPGGQLAFLNISKSAHFDLLRLLATETKFGTYMDNYERNLPTWFEEGKDFEQDLRADGSLPPGLTIVSMQTHKMEHDIQINTLANFLYSVGPLSGRLTVKGMELEVREWYCEQLAQSLEVVAGDIVKFHHEVTIGVLQKEG